MAQEVTKKVSLQVVFVSGVDEFGQDILSTRTFNNINEGAAADDLLAVANGIASLQTLPLSEVNKVQTNTLDE